MAKITELLKNILSARYGKDVRQSIHDAIVEIDKVADTAQDSATQMAQIATEKAEQASQDAEMIMQSIGDAITSATNARASEVNSKTSETNAKASEDNAKVSEENAQRVFESLPEDYTELSNAFYNTAIKQTASGETIHATDSTDSKVLEFGLHGKAEQTTTTGAQLFDKDNRAINGGISNSNGTVYSDANVFSTQFVNVSDLSNIAWSGLSDTAFTWGAWYDSNKTFLSGIYVQGKKIAVPDGAVYVRLTFLNTYLDTLMLNEGTTALPWEKFTGNAPSPSPEYPQDIEVAGASGSIEVKSVGKNLLKNTATTQTKYGVTFTVNDDKSVTVNGTATAVALFTINDAIGLDVGNYILSGGLSGGGIQTYTLRCVDLDGKYYADDGKSINIQNGITKCEIRVASGVTVNNLTFYPMIRDASDIDDTYQPYTETTATISTPDGLCGINGVYDEVVKYADGSGKRIQRIGKAVFDGSDDEGWYMTTSRNKYRPTIAIPIKADNTIYDIAHILCTHYQAKSSADTYEEIEGIASSLHSVIFIYDSNYNTSDISLWRTHLAENPITVWYELATPIITDLTAEEIAEIEKLHTFYPVTNISNDADCNMTVKYLADSKNYIDNQLALQAKAQEEALMAMLLLMPAEVQAFMIENDINNILTESGV